MSFFTYGAKEHLGKRNKLMKIERLINWSKVGIHLQGLSKSTNNPFGGRKSLDELKLFKCLLLQSWHHLSDPELEESMRVRLDFMLFSGFEMDHVPDETTFCRFRNKLVQLGLDKKLFQEINKQLEDLGLKIKEAEGAVIDATIIKSANRPNQIIEEIQEDRKEEITNEESSYVKRNSKDPDARWLKKGKKNYFGYKGFIATDTQKGYINDVHVISANRSESKELDRMTENIKAKRIYADKAYTSKENRNILKSKGFRDGIMEKSTRGHPLSFWQKIKNKLISKKRFIVEQGFGTLKRRFRFSRASYKGKDKVEAQFRFKAICFNLIKAVNQIQFAY